jgi:hypothetical protein
MNEPPSKIRGRRECRVPEAPAASCAKVESTRVRNHGHAGITRHSPRNGLNGFLRALPGDRALLPPSLAECSANLMPASGHQDHTTSPYASKAVRLTALLRPSHPVPNVRDDRETPLLRARDGAGCAGDLGVRSMTPCAADWHDGRIGVLGVNSVKTRHADLTLQKSSWQCEIAGSSTAR